MLTHLNTGNTSPWQLVDLYLVVEEERVRSSNTVLTYNKQHDDHITHTLTQLLQHVPCAVRGWG